MAAKALGLFLLLIFINDVEVSVKTSENVSEETLNLCNGTTTLENYTTTKTDLCECGERKTCIRKCCKDGYYHFHAENPDVGLFESVCLQNDSMPLNLSIYDGKEEISPYEGPFMVGMLTCDNDRWQYFKMDKDNPNEKFYIQKNGSLYYPYSKFKFYDNNRYCIDGEDGLTAYLCYSPEDPSKILSRALNSAGMIISMPFLLITFLVYLVLPDSNIHRKALMFYVMSLLIAYICLVCVQLYREKIEAPACEALGLCIIFFFLVSFFWMNVMCIDIFLAFRGFRGFTGKKSAETKRFLLYCLYALGLPTLHVLLLLTLNRVVDSKSDYSPQIGKTKCFLEDGIPNLLYFYGPMGVLLTINIILFILTAIKIQQVKKETSMLKHSDSKRHSYENDKQKFNLYVKLLLAMGVNWIMEIISWAFIWKMGQDMPNSVWYLTDFVNAMYGVLIFFIFVFKRKIWKSLQKRYYVFIGKPHLAHSTTMTQTTRSSNYSTTDTGLTEHRLSELRNGRAEERALTSS